MDDEKIASSVPNQPQLESHTERRAFFKEAGLFGMGAFLMPNSMALAQQPPPGVPVLQPPVKVDNFQNNENALSDGTETYLTYNSVGSNQVTSVNKFYSRRVENGPAYTVFCSCTVSWYPAGKSISESTPWFSTQSYVISGVKGEVSGNMRKDKVSITTIYGNGEINQTAEREVLVWISKPPEMENMSFQDTVNYFLKKHKANR